MSGRDEVQNLVNSLPCMALSLHCIYQISEASWSLSLRNVAFFLGGIQMKIEEKYKKEN